MKFILLFFITFSTLFSAELILTGTVISNNQKMIPARYMGYVKKVNFEVGDRVEREDTLFELESAEFDILESQADLALEQSKLMLDVYKTRLSRNKGEKRKLKRDRKKMLKIDFWLIAGKLFQDFVPRESFHKWRYFSARPN